MFSESLIVGLIVLLLCGTAFFYIYVRTTFLEKKFLVMESILVDLRVAMDSLMIENISHPPAPIATTPGVETPSPVQAPSDGEAIPEEKFYSSVLEQAHENQEAQEGQTADAVLESFEAPAPLEQEPPAKVNLDGMTRAELVAFADLKGIRVKKSMSRAEVLAMLRRIDPTQNNSLATGAENVSGSTEGSQQLGSSLDGGQPLDMEQGEQLDQ